ncbi:hypothetical protein DBIPINDM_008315 (plasmid) [Mesorhizobium sp. AR02]|uniref:DUF6894 family protein n=1 Tax=Mesorhizobium sp. AR02 TaxID=2865837 RepID=UPI00215EBE09|nr:hypothetical protein [Mesorhizobium sp. AR02]UVK57374.1 hypothetical protein DBIPINDM_008315 [Mesorhizobium sp. AR02]
MQLVDTVVHRRSPHDVVEFVGEGGEASYTRDDERRGKQRRRSFERLDVGGADVASDLYTFEYQDKGVMRVMPGISLPTHQAVQDEVNRSAEDLWRDALDKAEAPVGWAVRARNSKGDIVASCSYEELQLRDA